MREIAGDATQRQPRRITSSDRPSGPRRLITPAKTLELTFVGVTAGTLLSGCVTPPSTSINEVIPTAIAPETVTATQPVINETATSIPTEQPSQREVPYPIDSDITPGRVDSDEAYRQETQRTVNELISFFSQDGRDGQAEYDLLILRLYQRLAYDVIKPINGGAGGGGFDENARNSLFPDANNFFEARLNDGLSWAISPKDINGNFWVPGESTDTGFTAYTSLVPPSYRTIDDFKMRRVETPQGTVAHLFNHPSGYIIIGFYDQTTGQLSSWWSAADGNIHPVQQPIPTETPLVPTPVIPTEAPTVAPTEVPIVPITETDPAELTVESFLNAMPSAIRATHENPSAATQEQKDAHDRWLVDAWRTVFSSLSDEQLSNMNLNRDNIASLNFGFTGETYTELGLEYPAYDYSLLQALGSFSRTVSNFNERPTIFALENDFWELIKLKGGEDWSSYLSWDEQYGREAFGNWRFRYVVDGTALHDVPIPGLDGVVADLAVRAHYYDINGNRQTILVAIVIRLPDGTLVDALTPLSREELDQNIIDYTGAYQIGQCGASTGAIIINEEDAMTLFEGYLDDPGVQAYLQFLRANQTALDEFISTGSPTLDIILPMSHLGVGDNNIFHGLLPTP